MPNQFDAWMKSLTLARWSQGQHNIDPEDFLARARAGEKMLLLDIRFPEEQTFVALPQSLHIPLNELPDRWQEIPSDGVVAIVCGSGQRATVAYVYLQNKGLDNVKVLNGGLAMLVQALNPATVWAMTHKG